MDWINVAFISLSILGILTIILGAIYITVLTIKEAKKKVEFVYTVNDELISAISRYIRSEMQIFYYKERLRIEKNRKDAERGSVIDANDLLFSQSIFDIDEYTKLYNIIRPFEELVEDEHLERIEDFIKYTEIHKFEKIKPFLSSDISI